MKSTPFRIGLLTLLLVGCDKEEPAASEAPKRPSLAERKEAKRKEIAARPPVAEPVEEELPAPPPAVQPEAPVAKTPPAAPPATTPAPSEEERRAQRAEAMAQRVAQMTEQFNTRMMENDANGDGLLTKDEMSGPMQRGFERMDGNGDGAIDATEREAMIKGMADRMSQFTRGMGRGPGGPGGRGGNGRTRD
jgi:type IV secretory pathway VirB10-like protein